MATMLVIYRTPANPEAFDRHYRDVHVPLALKLPRLREYTISRGPIAEITAGQAPYLVGRLQFDSLDHVRAAFASEIGAACAEDRKVLAPTEGDCTILLFDDDAYLPVVSGVHVPGQR